MIPLYRDTGFTFRFAEMRRIDRIHLEGAVEGQMVRIYRLDAGLAVRGDLWTSGRVAADGWVRLAQEIIVGPEVGFVAEIATDPRA